MPRNCILLQKMMGLFWTIRGRFSALGDHCGSDVKDELDRSKAGKERSGSYSDKK